MSSTVETQIANLTAAMLAMSGEMREMMRETVAEAVRAEIDRLVDEGRLAVVAPLADAQAAPPAPAHDEPAGHMSDLLTGNFDLIKLSLVDLVERLDLTRDYVAGLTPADGQEDQIQTTTGELRAVISATEQATNKILETAESIQTLLDENADRLGVDLYEAMGTHVIDLMTACSFQDITGQRIAASMHTLLHLDVELRRLVELWDIEEGRATAEIIRNHPDDARTDKHLLHGPQHEGAGMSQDDIDAMLRGF
ncbi:chemotaxis protein [Caenispirillum salinarum]|uniref:chemotaxis protein n=1 Tax=Caenispirillum salinarum TaxID=859058 RepID=UPI00384D4994